MLLLFYVFEVGKVRFKSKCPNDINTEWAIPEIILHFLLYPGRFHILNPPPSLPPQIVFFYYNVCTVITDCNHPFDTSTFIHIPTRIHLLQLKIPI